MSADFWAGYIGGAASIIIGNPLDVKKVRLQAAQSPSSHRYFPPKSSLVTGTAAPILGYGLLNGILFSVYDRTEEILNRAFQPSASLPYSSISSSNAGTGNNATGSNLWTIWLAGAIGGLAVWSISTPTDLIKCRAQLAPTQTHTPSSSWGITCTILRTEGIRGLYCGGVVTALRDSIGYGFYFWTYEFCGRLSAQLASSSSFTADNGRGSSNDSGTDLMREAAKVLLCGGMAGVVSWASVYPLDVIKTKVQAQIPLDPTTTPLLGTAKRKGAVQIFKESYREGGMRSFFRGLGWCSLRAFIVNAVQWGVYELVMFQLSQPKVGREEEFHY
ncbi:mitochondrial carrier [Xylaria cf. heliscus]|nr:mitochondrial carrier [Xylaria cf. heliscus]